MIEDPTIYETRPVRHEPTEDGDVLATWEVRAKGFAGVLAFIAQFDRHPEFWTAIGDGWLVGNYHVLIDGAEIAIERRNDEWAQRQQDIEDHAIGRY